MVGYLYLGPEKLAVCYRKITLICLESSIVKLVIDGCATELKCENRKAAESLYSNITKAMVEDI